jgi:UDP-GlcNAc:undecaprenyl-phosphate/decaprenyl-phosphate GlcNAc-1-phosphate transferase
MGISVLIAAILGAGTTLLLIPAALRFGWAAVLLGRPTDWHHTSNKPVPRFGGTVLAVAFIAVEIYIALFHSDLRAGTPGRNIVVAGSLAMFALGFWDDVRPLKASRKLLGQTLIAATVCYCGVGIEVCRVPFSGTTIHLGGWGPILTLIWLVSVTNLINLIDGVDGLAGGISLMLMILIAAVAHQNGNFELLASGMAGGLLGFLCFNFPPARVYLGDGGAYFLGFQIALYSLVNSHKGTVFAALVAPLFVLALPVTDALLTLTRRGLRGLPLFRPDRKHLHHRLIAVGCSRRKLVLLVYAFNSLFLFMGLAAFWSRGQWVPILSGAAVLFLLACAGSFRFSRRWFAVHRVVRSSLKMREEVQYALSLTHWLELESRRTTNPDELWPDFVFAADKLGFASLKLTLQGEYRFWERRAGSVGSSSQRFDCPNGHYGSLEFTGPSCPLGRSGPADYSDCDGDCVKSSSGCLADPRVFETVSELLAETWNRSAAQWNGHGIPLRFKHASVRLSAPGNGNGFVHAPQEQKDAKCPIDLSGSGSRDR